MQIALLRRGDLQARIWPGYGGALQSLTFRGQDLLRPAPLAPTHPRHTACFPLVPYANRIAHGRFRWDGRQVDLGLAIPDEPHALHGDGWLASWRILDHAADNLTLHFNHAAGAWPWDYEATQQITLHDASATMVLTLVNRSSHEMPAGLGLHPAFPRHAASSLAFAANGRWTAGSAGLANQWHDGVRRMQDDQPVAELVGTDDCFGDWGGELRIAGGPVPLRLTAQGADCLHVYVPAGAASFCAEPVTHAPDAVNTGGRAPMATLSPGQSLRLVMTLQPDQPLGTEAKDGSAM